MRGRRLALALACTMPWAAQADSLRCAGGVVTHGDSMEMVERKCGAPGERQRYQRERKIRTIAGMDGIDIVEVQTWTYRRGYGKFVQYLTFESGVLTRIDRGPRQE